MEVFLRNVPQYLYDEDLRDELGPVMKTLKIGEWDVQKPRNKRFSWITFLEASDGERFLQKHGEQTPPSLQQGHSYGHLGKSVFSKKTQNIARLHLLHMPVFACLSNRPPDPWILNHLETRRRQHDQTPQDDSGKPVLAYTTTKICCGHNMFLSGGDTPTFIEQTRLETKATAKFGQRFLIVTFEDGARMNISFDTVESWALSSTSAILTLVLREPPRCFKTIRNSVFEMFSLSSKLERCLHLPSWPNHDKYIAHCLVYQIWLRHHKLNELVTSLQTKESVSLTRCDIPTIVESQVSAEDYLTAYHVFEVNMDILSLRNTTLPFAIRFQIHALVYNCYLHPTNALELLRLVESQGHVSPMSTEAVKPLFETIPFASPGCLATDFDAELLMESISRTEAELCDRDPNRDPIYGLHLPPNQVWVFKAMVTPTSIKLEGPEPDNKNGVLRMFPDRTDFFLRVTFCDEDGQGPHFNSNVSNENVFSRYRQVLRDGIRVAGRHFSFLGFSHSSLRAHSVWFSAPFKDDNQELQTHNTILSSLGDFAHIRVPARCAARIGQAFSDTPYAVSLARFGIEVTYIADIKSKGGSRVFSDGVGTISRDALEKIWQDLFQSSATATCLQIRLGGIKGILSLDSRLPGKVICIRKESMEKFPSELMGEMGICGLAARPLPMYLNRQLIKILEDMGTSNEWFHNCLIQAVDNLQEAATTPAKTSSLLESQGIATSMSLPWFIQELGKLAIDFRGERFLKSVVDHAILRELRLLKQRARIRVHQGVTLFGVLDEYEFLAEGEIYVAYDKKHIMFSGRRDISLHDGLVIITRSPALHPGDVRVVKQMTPPPGHPLLDLQNCIVFSQKGDRDLPSQLSGGDLDGDLYNVIWDAEAIPKKRFSPADYPRVLSTPLDREVTQDDIADFFINFMKTDILGLIATRHQIWADISTSGTLDPQCVKLAEMHSAAVDYSKTGKHVELSELPKAPQTRPDFLALAPPVVVHELGQLGDFNDEDEGDEEGLGRVKHKYHRSEKILGQLYRAVDEKKIWKEQITARVIADGPTVWSQVQRHVEDRTKSLGLDLDFTSKMHWAQKIRDMYEKALRDKMWEFSETPRKSLSEQEVFCGSILNKRSAQTRRQRDASIRLREEMDRISAWIVKLIRGRRNLDGETPNSERDEDQRHREDAIELSWACLVVGQSQDQPASRSRRGRQSLQSFAVVAACCLLKELDDVLKDNEQRNRRARSKRGTGEAIWQRAEHGHRQSSGYPHHEQFRSMSG